MYDKGFIWNPSNCKCECDKSCDIGEFLDYKSCKCRNNIVYKLLEECSENIDGKEILYNETLNAIPLNLYNIPLFAVFFITNICSSSVFIYFHWYFKKDNVCVKFNPSTQTAIY